MHVSGRNPRGLLLLSDTVSLSRMRPHALSRQPLSKQAWPGRNESRPLTHYAASLVAIQGPSIHAGLTGRLATEGHAAAAN
jgi:hypothetical protein